MYSRIEYSKCILEMFQFEIGWNVSEENSDF